MKKINNKTKIILIAVIILLVLGLLYYLLIGRMGKNGKNDGIFTAKQSEIVFQRPSAAMGSDQFLDRQPFVSLNAVSGQDNKFLVSLNSLPISSGPVTYYLSFTDKKNGDIAQTAFATGNYQMTSFPFKAEIDFNSNCPANTVCPKNNAPNYGYLISNISAAKPYHTEQYFTNYPSLDKNILESDDGHFKIEGEMLKNQKNLTLLTAAGIPALEGETSAVTINTDTRHYAIAYQISFSGEKPVGKNKISFKINKTENENEESLVMVMGYDMSTKKWTELETVEKNSNYIAETENFFDLYLLARKPNPAAINNDEMMLNKEGEKGGEVSDQMKDEMINQSNRENEMMSEPQAE